ncbi:MJ1255/VC2487 family glycosyltransferase [Methylotetracoccus oryzae]|uniref:MJ1255/VC2487 family glycosyltransferase n=1 Tax=Methylotetracoccus oryzae TaxID=1919059 RepID=UPI00111B0C4B|nr:MJ1255/VC2487 family glycosyltransferase [Methylotetracoccus oryzae]
MKILYGVQATGNGHITRARVMAPLLRAAGADVTFLFTGRPWSRLFDMEIFGDFEWRAGLTFQTHAGQVDYFKTALHNDLPGFVRDVRRLAVREYDLVITDFEPVTAWAAKLRGVRAVGIGHQYAFAFPIPRTGDDFLARTVMKSFAPASISLGLHWHHFDQPILPPIIETPAEPDRVLPEKILVYLPFEDARMTVRLLQGFREFQFHVYGAGPVADKPSHIHVRPPSRHGFHNDLRDCAGVICNAGFELASEALQMGKKLMVKPLHAQLEQLSNALALEQLGFGTVMPDLDEASVGFWLKHGQARRVVYPRVAEAVVEWLLGGDLRVDPLWVASVWERVVYSAGDVAGPAQLRKFG